MLVVARYNESVEWTRDYPNKIIYNKGDRSTIPEDLHHCVIDIPNVGRETHTILYHIINNYDNLNDITVFSQGKYDDHMTTDEFNNLFNLNELGYSTNYICSSIFGKYKSTYTFRIMDWKGKLSPTKYNENYGQWYERVIQKPFPEEHKIIWTGSFFGITSKNIKQYSKEFYERLLNEGDLNIHHSPEAAHFMERTWTKLFVTA